MKRTIAIAQVRSGSGLAGRLSLSLALHGPPETRSCAFFLHATFYKWKARYGGLQISDVRRLKDLESENGKLKKLLAETMLDNAGLKGLLAKNF